MVVWWQSPGILGPVEPTFLLVGLNKSLSDGELFLAANTHYLA
jgi:hypothetical protein